MYKLPIDFPNCITAQRYVTQKRKEMYSLPYTVYSDFNIITKNTFYDIYCAITEWCTYFKKPDIYAIFPNNLKINAFKAMCMFRSKKINVPMVLSSKEMPFYYKEKTIPQLICVMCELPNPRNETGFVFIKEELK